MPQMVIELLAFWKGCWGMHQDLWSPKVIHKCWKLHIWKERNGCTFEEKETTIENLKHLFLRLSLSGCRLWPTDLSDSSSSFHEFINL